MSKPKVIGIDASRANRAVRTGVEWYAYHLIEQLKTIVPADVRVVLYSETPLQGPLATLPPNWESRVLHWPPRRLWTIFRLSWEMLTQPPDVLFVPAYVPPPITPRCTVTTVHDVAFYPFPQGYTPWGRFYLKVMTRFAVRAGRILTVSEFSKRDIVQFAHASAERIDVTPLGSDMRYAPVDEAEVGEALARYGLSRPYFLFVGRLETKKNIAGLLRAFAAYRAARPHEGAKFVLVGVPGKGFADEMRALTPDIAPHVMRPGYVAAEDMAALYSGATAFVFVSHYEGFGIPLLEAFACGTPVVASNTTSIPEIAGDAAALYVSPADVDAIARAMAKIADDAALRESLRQKGFARVKQFSWADTAARTWKVFADMLAK